MSDPMNCPCRTRLLSFKKLKGDQRIEEINAQGQQDWNSGALDALEPPFRGRMHQAA